MEPDELDLQLINVLQVRPRARWSHVAPILSISAGACATRWKRLRGNGLAWTTAHPALGGARPMSGIIEVRTPPAQRRELITQACLDPRVVGVDELVVGGGLLLSVAVDRLDDYRRLRDGLQVGPAEVSWDAIITGTVTHGADWRLDTLDADQLAMLGRLSARDIPAGHTTRGDLDPVLALFARDPRATPAEMSRVLGRDPRTVRQQISQLLHTDFVGLRCDAANEAIGWPVTTVWFGSVPPALLESAVASLRTMPNVRVALTLMGDVNLCFSVLHRSLDGVGQVPTLIGRLLPGFQLARSTPLVRSHKRSGWLLDETGRCTGHYVQPTVLCARYVDAAQ
jgi:DNA-binding Lrp family transcriptional regulator